MEARTIRRYLVGLLLGTSVVTAGFISNLRAPEGYNGIERRAFELLGESERFRRSSHGKIEGDRAIEEYRSLPKKVRDKIEGDIKRTTWYGVGSAAGIALSGWCLGMYRDKSREIRRRQVRVN